MDLVQACCNLQQASTIGKVQMAVAKKILQSQQDQGNAALKLVQAATANTNQAGDALVAASLGLGGEIDTYA